MFLHFIEEFLDAYRILEERQPLPINMFFVKAFLLGRCIELVLKNELILKGYTSIELKKKEKGGHDLIKLLNLLGYPNNYVIDYTTYDSINHLNHFYNDKGYEYPKHKDVEIKNVKFLVHFIELSVKKIRFHLKKDKLKEYSE